LFVDVKSFSSSSLANYAFNSWIQVLLGPTTNMSSTYNTKIKKSHPQQIYYISTMAWTLFVVTEATQSHRVIINEQWKIFCPSRDDIGDSHKSEWTESNMSLLMVTTLANSNLCCSLITQWLQKDKLTSLSPC